jgi:hypothetical protein
MKLGVHGFISIKFHEINFEERFNFILEKINIKLNVMKHPIETMHPKSGFICSF